MLRAFRTPRLRAGAAAADHHHARAIGPVRELAARIGPRLQLSAGPLVVGAGLALLILVPSGSSYVLYVLPAVFGLGIAITVAPLTAVTITNPAREHRDAAIPEPCLHCGLDAPPLAASTDRRILAIQPRG
jgi:hypothetical protein